METPIKKSLGTVYLVGSGPGEVGLLTLRAVEILKKAEIVFYDYLVNPEVLKFCPQATLQDVGKVGHGSHISQEEIETQLIGAAREHSIIVRLKGGDPFIFGRGGEEALALAGAGVPFEIVPGVTSAIAVPAYAGIPLTHRDLASGVTLMTGHEDPQKMEKEGAAPSNTVVFLMGVKTLQENFQKLSAQGMAASTPAAIIQWGTYPGQKTIVGTLATLPELVKKEGVEPPAIVVVGEVVRLREKLKWFETKPLFGKTILVTRSREQASQLSPLLQDHGAAVVEFPTLEFHPPSDRRPLQRAIKKLGSYDWILFTSTNAVDYFFKELAELKLDVRNLGQARLVAVGPMTQRRIESLGLHVERHPEEFTGEALGKIFNEKEIRGKHLLLPRAEVAGKEVVEALRRRGAVLDEVAVYRTMPTKYSPEEIERTFKSRSLDLLTFASSSSANNFLGILKDSPFLPSILKIPCMVIGPITREAVEELGFNVVGMPKRYTIPDLVEEITKYFSSAKI